MSSEALQPTLDIVEVLNSDREFQFNDGDEYKIHPNRVARIEACHAWRQTDGGSWEMLRLKTLSVYPNKVGELHEADATWLLKTAGADGGRLVDTKRYHSKVDTANTIYQFINYEQPSSETDGELTGVLQQIRAQHELELDMNRRRNALGKNVISVVMGFSERLDDFTRQALKYKFVRTLLKIIH